jgi:hypothetical protein
MVYFLNCLPFHVYPDFKETIITNIIKKGYSKLLSEKFLRILSCLKKVAVLNIKIKSTRNFKTKRNSKSCHEL